METVIEGLIARFGAPVTLSGPSGERKITALVQAMRHRGYDQQIRSWTALGSQEPGRFLMLCNECPGGFDMVQRGAERFWLRRWERYELQGRTLYYWAVLTKEEAAWN